MATRPFIVVLGAGLLVTGLPTSARQEASPLPPLVPPAGFHAEVFAEEVENARSMAIGLQGTVFVGSQYVGKVHAVVDSNNDYKADRVVVIASGPDQPNGVAIRNGALYVATASRLLRFDDIEKHLDAPPAPVTLRDDLPNPKAGHTWKFIGFGPDDMLYMTVGAPCNVCLSPLPLTRPDGLRTVGPQTLIQAEGQGRLTELTIKGNRAEVRVLREGLTAATGVTVAGDTAFVLVERAKAVVVPYRPQ
jgi:glucose/arabinose dehydrogenase